VACIHDPVLQRVRREETQLDLDSRNWVHSMCLANRICIDLAQANTSDFAFCHQLSQCFDRDLNRCFGVDSSIGQSVCDW
jgi:hypothetical protein